MPKEKIKSNEEFLQKISESQKLISKQEHNLETVKQKFETEIKSFNNELKIYYGGSYARKTLIKESLSLDIIVLWPTSFDKESEIIHKRMGLFLHKKWKGAKPKNLGWSIPFKSGFYVDIIPGVLTDDKYDYAKFYCSDQKRSIETSIKMQDDFFINNDRSNVLRLLKIWKLRRQVPIHNFILEAMIVDCLKGITRNEYENQTVRCFDYIRDSIENIEVYDPINRENNLSYLITKEERKQIKKLAQEVKDSKTWNKVFKK